MSEEEHKAKRAAHKVEVRARQKAERDAAAAAAAAERKITLHQFNDVLEQAYLDGHPDSADDFHELTLNEWDALCAWVAEQPEGDEFALDCCMEFYDAWRNEGSPDPMAPAALPTLHRPRVAATLSAPSALPAPDDDPNDPWSSWDCYYDGPGDQDRAERRARAERERRAQPRLRAAGSAAEESTHLHGSRVDGQGEAAADSRGPQ